jgi:hypothetical protein
VTDREPLVPPRTGESPVNVADALEALAAENAAVIASLRGAQIQQQVGMAAACRTLTVELPRELVASVNDELRSGVLAQRWEAARAAAIESAAAGEVDPGLMAVAILLREQSRSVTRHLIARGKAWTADAYRMEGQAAALEAQVERLRRVARPQVEETIDTSTACDVAAMIG